MPVELQWGFALGWALAVTLYVIRGVRIRQLQEKISRLSDSWLDEFGITQAEVTHVLRGLQEVPPGYRVPLNEVPVRIQALGMLKTWISQHCSDEAKKWLEFAACEEKQQSIVYFRVCQSYITKRMLEEALGIVKK